MFVFNLDCSISLVKTLSLDSAVKIHTYVCMHTHTDAHREHIHRGDFILGKHNKIPETGWLKQEKFTFSWFWGPGSKVRVPVGLDFGEAHSQECHVAFLLCVQKDCVVSSSPCKDTTLTGLGFHPLTSLNFNDFTISK